MTRRILLVLSFFIGTSSVGADKEGAIFDYINKGDPGKALSVLPLSECETYLDACAKLGVGLFQFESHIEQGKEYLSRSASAGHARAKVVLGNFLIEGTFYEKDAAAGIRLLEEAVDLGASEGMFYLANQYHQGLNVEKNDTKAMMLYEQASAMGHIYAPFNAGVLHWEKHQDCETTERYFSMSAPYMEDASKALEKIRSQEPCSSILAR